MAETGGSGAGAASAAGNEAPTRSGTRKARPRKGRQALLDAAEALVTELRLRDVLAQAGVRAVAERAGVVAGTVSHHFPSEDNKKTAKKAKSGDPNPALARGVVEHVLRRSRAGIDAVRDTVADPKLKPGEGDRRFRELLGEGSAGAEVFTGTKRDVTVSTTLLAAAVARHDPDASAPLREHYDALVLLLVEVVESTLRASGRRMAAGTDVESFAFCLSALIDGFLMRATFDPERATNELLSRAALRLFDSFTVSESDVDEPDPEHVLAAVVADAPLDVAERDAIVAAALDRYRKRGWQSVSLTAVAADMGVSRHTVTRHFGHRNTLAAAIWATYLPDIEAGLRHDERLRVDRLLARHVQRLVEQAHRHPRLTAALVSSFWYQTVQHATPGTDAVDPRVMAPLPMVLLPTLEEHRSSFRPGIVDTPERALDFAAMLTTTALTGAIGRPTRTASEIAAYVVATTVAGALQRRPREL